MKVPFKTYFRLLGRYLSPQMPRAVLMGLLMGGAIAMQLWNPQLLRRFIDGAVAGRAGEPLGSLAVAYILIALGYRVLLAAGKFEGENVGQTATNWLRNDLTLHCLRLDLTFHKTHPAGEMIERLDGDVNLLSNFFSQFWWE